MIRQFRQNPKPPTAADKPTYRLVLSAEPAVRSVVAGKFVCVPVQALRDGPVLLVASDGTPGQSERLRHVPSELGAAAHSWLYDLEHKPDRAAALDLPDEAA